jgi:hypothetical protein
MAKAVMLETVVACEWRSVLGGLVAERSFGPDRQALVGVTDVRYWQCDRWAARGQLKKKMLGAPIQRLGRQ